MVWVCVGGGTSFQTNRWKCSTWSRLIIRFLVLSPDPACSLGPMQTQTNPSADRFQYRARHTGSDKRAGWGLGTRLPRVLLNFCGATQEERVWWCSANPSGFINNYFLVRIFHPPITLQKTLFVVATLETLAYFSMMTAIFWHWKKWAISSQLQYFTTPYYMYFFFPLCKYRPFTIPCVGHGWTLLIKMARSSLIDFSYLNRLALRTFNKGGLHFLLTIHSWVQAYKKLMPCNI